MPLRCQTCEEPRRVTKNLWAHDDSESLPAHPTLLVFFVAGESNCLGKPGSHSSLFPFVSGNCVVISAASRYPAAHK
jgi:hypothetical protein